MLRREDVARIPDFASQRVRQASITARVVDGTPSRIVRCTFGILDIDGDGVLDVEGWTSSSSLAWATRSNLTDLPTEPRGSSLMQPVGLSPAAGSWEPDQPLLRRIEAAA